MEPQFGDLVRVDWIDIQSDSTWIGREEETLKPAVCTSYGIFNGQDNGVLRLFGSYNEDDIGDRIVMPESVVESIVIIKRKVYGRKTTQ